MQRPRRSLLLCLLMPALLLGLLVSPTQLALGGVRALWTTYAGGLTRETVVESSAPGEHSGAMECLSVIAGSIPACQSEMRRR